MLDSLRKLGRTWIGKIVGVFLLIGLAGFGISNVIFDVGSNTVARVGNEDITTREFVRAYEADKARMSQQFGMQLTDEQAVSLNLPASTMSTLSAQAAVDQLTRQLGLGVSDARLALLLRQDQAFTGPGGQFDPDYFRLVLQRSGFTEAEYFALQARSARRDQLFAALLGDVVSPTAGQELQARHAADQRTLDYFVISPETILPVAEPTEEELAAYLAENQAEYRTVETRSAQILPLTVAVLAASEEITDDEVAAEYERTRDSRVRPERREIRQAVLATPEQQAAFAAGLAAGQPFDELVTAAGLTATTLGNLTRTEIADPALARAAFDVPDGGFAIIPGVGGQRAISAAVTEPGGEVPLVEVSDAIRTDLAEAAARRTYIDILDQVEELRASFQPLPEIAERFGLPLETVTLAADGAALAEIDSIAADAAPRVAAAIFSAPEDRLTATVAITANSNFFVDVTDIEPARDQTLDEVRDTLTVAWIQQKTSDAMLAEVEKALAQLDAGTPFADVAVGLNQTLLSSDPLTRDGGGSLELSVEVAQAAFGGGDGFHGSAVNAAGNHVVFEVTEIIPSSGEPSQTVLDNAAVATRDSLRGDLITALRDDAGVRTNMQVFNQLTNPVPAQ